MSMQAVLEEHVERQTREITALYQTIARLERDAMKIGATTYLSDWVSKLEEGHTLTANDIAVLRRVQMCLESADKHHQQARAAQEQPA